MTSIFFKATVCLNSQIPTCSDCHGNPMQNMLLIEILQAFFDISTCKDNNALH